MPIDTALATRQWNRYAWCRDNGHAKFIEKSDVCDAFFRGDQWTEEDKIKLRRSRRPALTINKILPTLANVMGEQIFNRSEISYRPRGGSPAEIAEALAKVFKQISDNNHLDWLRSDVFANGIISSRGFFDVRLGFNDSMQGEIEITAPNPKNVIIDPDAEFYDPDTWADVFTTKWVTADDIAVLYSKEDAELLRNRDQSYFPYGYDSVQSTRDRFGDRHNPMYNGVWDESSVMRNIRVIERQHRMLDKQKHFVSPETGDMRPIPESFDRDRIAFFVEKVGFQVTTKLVRRIRWTVIADNVVLHDDWSPYKHFTIVPYFPYLRHGTTIGLAENLLGSQELLNKTSSQELHIVNTTANSGWKMKTGTLTNMGVQEFEERGAETGLVIEVNDMDGLEKITPNTVPSGLDRISYKAEEHIKTISGVSDSAQGFDREDVAAKAIQAKRQAGSTNLAKPLDNLTRTDSMLARNVLDIVQEFYTEPRLMTITKDAATGETETFGVNQPTPEGEILNDLTLGEYGVVVTSVPLRETLEDSQFDQAMAMREKGIMIPDAVLVDSSRLMNKKDIIKQMTGNQESPEAQAAKALQLRGQQAEVEKVEGEAAQKHADATLKQAKAQETTIKAEVLANTPIESPQGSSGPGPELEYAKAAQQADLDERKFGHQQQIDFAKLQNARDKQDQELWMEAQDAAQKRADERAAAAREAAKPTTSKETT
jgi:hypothetical protein